METLYKMKIRCRHALLICSLLISNLVFSQSQDDTVTVSKALLFPHFTEGVIVFKNGSSCRNMMNYNIYLDEMQFIGPNKEVLSLAEPEKVSMIIIDKRNFINYKNYFIEILSEGSVSLCLRIHQKRFTEKGTAYGGTSSTSSIANYSSINLNDAYVTKLSINEHYTYHTDFLFYLMRYSKMKLVLNQNDLLKYFSGNKELLKQEMKSQHTKFDSIDSMKKIVEWMNANETKN
jgi:hypothetical protein